MLLTLTNFQPKLFMYQITFPTLTHYCCLLSFREIRFLPLTDIFTATSGYVFLCVPPILCPLTRLNPATSKS
nr:MAG TPA: hypothetical protein [Caudoviricetes sp.]